MLVNDAYTTMVHTKKLNDVLIFLLLNMANETWQIVFKL